MSYLWDTVQDIRIKDNKAIILLQPSKDSTQNMSFWIVDSLEISHIRSLYQKMGYSTQFNYNADADSLILSQKDKLLKEWYASRHIDEISKQIEWSSPT